MPTRTLRLAAALALAILGHFRWAARVSELGRRGGGSVILEWLGAVTAVVGAALAGSPWPTGAPADSAVASTVLGAGAAFADAAFRSRAVGAFQRSVQQR